MTIHMGWNINEDGQEKLRYDGDEEGEIFKQFQIFLKKREVRVLY